MNHYGVQMLWAARYDYEQGQILPKHCHEYYQMIYIIDGEGDFFLGDASIAITQETLFFIKPQDQHGIKSKPGNCIKTLDVKFEVHNTELIKQLSGITSVVLLQSDEVKLLLEKIRQEGLKKKSDYQHLSILYLLQILLTILRIKECTKQQAQITDEIMSSQHDKVCEKVKAYIQDHFDKDILLKDMAGFLGYNESYICQTIKKEFHCTPMQYLYKYRITKGKELIMYSDYSLKKIADRIGFKTVHHFSRVFKKAEKMPPGQWREMERKGIRKDVFFTDNFVEYLYKNEAH
ncbi:MAG: hypothetical protein K0S61_2384 [Anaerocolumna sp.]|nr:hypothetical protein [Anaerocolumna sp.]